MWNTFTEIWDIPNTGHPKRTTFRKVRPRTALAERQGKNFQRFKDFCLTHGSSQGQNLVLTVSCVLNSLEINILSLSNSVPKVARMVVGRTWTHMVVGRTLF